MKNKKIKALFCVILSIVTLFCFVSCSTQQQDKPSGGGGNANQGQNAYVEQTYPTFDGGVHIHNSVKTNKNLVSSGGTAYSVVVPDDASDVLLNAVTDLVYFIKSSSGASLKIVYDSDYTSGKAISIGNTNLFKNANISLAQLGESRNGYIIKTVGDNVYVCAQSHYGLSNGIYGFLEETINWRIYAESCILYDSSKNLPLYNYDVVEIPDFEWRVANYGIAKETGDATFARRTKMNLEKDVWIQLGSYYHNSYVLLPPNEYADEHPEWYWKLTGGDETLYSGGGQLCYSKEDMRLEFVERLKEYIIKYPGVENVTLTQEDNHDWCECEDCKASKEKYGANSAVVIKFMNKVHTDITQWMEEEGYDWDLNIAFFAYHPTVDAPCYEENGKYYPIDDSVICKPGVSVFYAPIEGVWNEDFYSESNEWVYDNMLKWASISEEMYLWLYSANFYHYLAPFDTWNSMQNIYIFSANTGVKYMYDQAQMNNLNGTDFYTLKYYLNSKLQWNVNLDMQELINDFFEGYFGAAAPYMLKYFNELRVRFQYIEEELGIKFFCYIETEKRDFWPLPLLNQWLGYLDEAREAVAYLKNTDPVAYQTMLDRIGLESLSLRYLKIQLYSATAFNEVSLLAEKKEFRREATKYGITRYKEGGLMAQLYSEWGLN